jgi:hypothetical protein
MVRKSHVVELTEAQKSLEFIPWRFKEEGPVQIMEETKCDLSATPKKPVEHSSFTACEHNNRFGVQRVIKTARGLRIGEYKAVSVLLGVQKEAPIEGYRIKKLLCQDNILVNSNFLDFLLENPDFYPENHKEEGHCLVAWGTVFNDWWNSGKNCLKAIRWDHKSGRPVEVTKTYHDCFCDKCFHMVFKSDGGHR